MVLRRRGYLLFVLSFGVRRCLLVANSSFAAAGDARIGNRWDSFSKDVRQFSFGLSVDGVQGFAFHGSFGSSLHSSNGTGNVGQPQHAALFKALPPRPRRFSHEIVEEAASTLGRGQVGTIARQPAADHATCLKCNFILAFAKLHQGRCRLGHLRFDNVQHLLAHVNVFDVQRFEVLTAFSFTFILDFSQDVRHLIAHHPAATDVRVYEQRTRGGFHRRLKCFVQVGEAPVDRGRQGQEPCSTLHPPASCRDGLTSVYSSGLRLGPKAIVPPAVCWNHPRYRSWAILP